ncbi:hypothetical protein DPEC_G00294940 [Dallia pectoralis]|uniref:Uncharacterized protein n=1 Tax=Dallia pectoralis TaxID=75939 RepID=A0ACC2FIE7_DALPE|nr:hypothetical protein DPEC_G00294940 [Dallia pectoralis]
MALAQARAFPERQVMRAATFCRSEGAGFRSSKYSSSWRRNPWQRSAAPSYAAGRCNFSTPTPEGGELGNGISAASTGSGSRWANRFIVSVSAVMASPMAVSVAECCPRVPWTSGSMAPGVGVEFCQC